LPASDPTIEALLSIADEAAACAMESWRAGQNHTQQWEKSPGQPVSAGDLAVDDLLRTRLGALLPDAAWLSEESAETPGRAAKDRVWVVDPIDGTRDYVRGRDGWAVSVALVENGVVQLATLTAPARGERWWAVRGDGAWRNGVRLRCGDHPTLSQARVPADHLRGVDIDYRLVPKPNSIALRMAMVAADEADVVATFRWGAEWDIAAASLIAQEAGAIVTDVLGEPLHFNKADPRMLGLLCCVPEIHDAAVARLRVRTLQA
jgi:myo-inositol-1(or 4)-monophosphatase